MSYFLTALPLAKEVSFAQAMTLRQIAMVILDTWIEDIEDLGRPWDDR